MSQEITDTHDGFIVGTDPKEPPRTSAQWADVQAETMAGTRPGNDQVFVDDNRHRNNSLPRTYTDEDLERIRREEKDKLYGRIQEMDAQLKSLKQEREEQEASRRAELEAKAEAERLKEESEMETRELLKRREEEWSSRFSELEDRYEQDRAVFERERRFQELASYRQARVDQEAEFIIPELRDLIRGNTEADIDASIEEMKERTAAIMGQFEQNTFVQRQAMRGAAPTAPPVGPMEQMTTFESITPEDIRSMDMETYKKYRAQLLNATGRNFRGL
jgi:DNA repair exonuclease SbcCD ATPase subunit